jgi:glycosyltransferase involved in cell wall biosynthesis
LSAAPVVVDVQAMQSAGYRERGVARYTQEFALALLHEHPEYVDRFLLNPNLPPPGDGGPLVASGKLTVEPGPASTDGGHTNGGPAIFHAMSPFELSVPLPALWPAWVSARRMRLVVTVYDLIPGLFPDMYLVDPGVRSRYNARLEFVRAADQVLAISRRSADDVVEHLGIAAEKVSFVGAAASSICKPPASRDAARVDARAAVPGLWDRFAIYTGAIEPRKNLDNLVLAYASLPAAVRLKWQLVIVCALDELQRNHYQVWTRELGLGDSLLLTGFVPDDLLVRLYQATDLMVFPSLYEGFGLPVADALACGAPAIAADNSSLVELVGPEARFDPTRPETIANKLEQALTDSSLRESLMQSAAPPQPSWADVADRTVEVYDRMLSRPRPHWRRTPRLAVVSPWPPLETGVAGYSERLVEAMRRTGQVEVDVYVDDPGTPSAGRALPPAWALPTGERVEGGYDHVLYCLGNSEFHAGALRLLRVCGRAGVVLAHDVRLTGLYRHGEPRGAVPEGFWKVLHDLYPALGDDVGEDGWLPPADAVRLGVLMAREIIHRATAFLATSEYAASLARADAWPGDAGKVRAVPFAYPPATTGSRATEPGLVASFGVVNEIKRTAALVEAVAMLVPARPDVHLAFVGPAAPEEIDAVSGLAFALGISHRVVCTGQVSGPAYRDWLGRADVAVQLRASSNGEQSAAVADCLAAGVPTVVSAIGAAGELPHDAVETVAAGASPADIAVVLGRLLDDLRAKDRLTQAARAHAATNGFDRSAAALLDVLASRR